MVKYWFYFLAKVSAAVAIGLCLQATLVRFYPKPKAPLPKFGPALPPFLHEISYTFICFGIGLIVAGLLYLSVWDQKRRCRTCLRRLIMPVSHGSWGHVVLFGRPRTEYICAYGHGTLSIADLQITGRELPDWQPHDDNIWKELESYHQAGK